mmetsp:Transcript_102/g.394  ORF Transcript_102/g.394 Transcript_102/m.394 type:complete len:263 (-) Transcript_102:75-863(-)
MGARRRALPRSLRSAPPVPHRRGPRGARAPGRHGPLARAHGGNAPLPRPLPRPLHPPRGRARPQAACELTDYVHRAPRAEHQLLRLRSRLAPYALLGGTGRALRGDQRLPQQHLPLPVTGLGCALAHCLHSQWRPPLALLCGLPPVPLPLLALALRAGRAVPPAHHLGPGDALRALRLLGHHAAAPGHLSRVVREDHSRTSHCHPNRTWRGQGRRDLARRRRDKHMPEAERCQYKVLMTGRTPGGRADGDARMLELPPSAVL